MSARLLAIAIAALSMLALPASGQGAEQEDPAAMAQRVLAATPSHGDRSLGDPEAPVVIIEYASATCPHCATFHVDVLSVIERDYIDTGKVRFIMREFPLDDLALAAFMLARCVPEEKYFATIDTLFRQQERWRSGNRKAELTRILGLTGLTEPDVNACLRNKRLSMAITESAKQARETLGIKSTPTIFVNGVRVEGARRNVEGMRKLIEAALEQSAR